LCQPIWVLITPDSSIRALWQIPAQIYVNQEEHGEKQQWSLLIKYLSHTPQGCFTRRKNLMTMGQRLYFPSEWCNATDFISLLKIHRPWPGLNPQTLVPMVSTITTRPPRLTRNRFLHFTTWGEAR
jgi:hypothetical protein